MRTARMAAHRRRHSKLLGPLTIGAAALTLVTSVTVVAIPVAQAATSTTGASSATSTSTPPDTGSTPPDQASEPDITSQVQGDVTQVDGLAATVNGWGLSCDAAGALDLQLAFVADALNQGNVVGAQTLLQAFTSNVNDQGQEGLLSGSEVAQFDTSEAADLSAIPNGGYFAHEFAPTTSVSVTNEAGCPANSSLESLSSPGAVSNVWDIIRLLLQGALHEVPVVGGVLAALVEILWPGSESDNNVTWDKMREYVEHAVNQAVDEKTKADLEADLRGLDSVLHNYTVAVSVPKPWTEADKNYIETQYVSSLNALEHDAPAFEPATRPYLVLAEYAQLHNMLFAQLKDGIVNGATFNLPAAAVADYKVQIASRISDATKYVPPQMDAAHKALPIPANGPHKNIEIYNSNAILSDALVPAVSDEQFYWPYMDPVKYPNPINPVNTRVLYTPSYGLIPDANLPKFNGEGKKPIVHISVWGFDRIDAMQLTYGSGSQPDPRMGDEQHCTAVNQCTGGTLDPPHGGSFQAAEVPDGYGYITSVSGSSGDVPEAVRFVFTKNGKTFDTGQIGSQTAKQNFSISFPNEVAGYVLIPGVAPSPYGSANGMIFGFRFADSYGS